MLNDNAKKWVAALRSGEYQQGEVKLCCGNKWCCLGVACDVARKSGLHVLVKEKHGLTYFDDDSHGLPHSVRQWLGLRDSLGRYTSPEGRFGWALFKDNDSRKLTFSQIADIIESEPEGLFVKSTPSQSQGGGE